MCIKRSETGGLMDSPSTRECEAHDGKNSSPVSGYVQTCLTARDWTDQWVTANFGSSVPDSLSKALWLRVPGASPDPRQLKICCLCQNFASTGLNNLFYSPLDIYCYSCYETFTHGSNFSTGSMDCLCFSLPGMLKQFYFFNKIEYSHAWVGVGIS